MKHKPRIPGSRLSRQHEPLRAKLDAAIARVMDRGVFTADREVADFEAEFADYLGLPHSVGVSSGGTALTLALVALGVTRDDEVISVPNVDISASAPVTHAGGRLVWVDIDPHTYNIDPTNVEQAITSKTRAIVVVHMYGYPADMTAIMDVAKSHGIPIVEDAALAHGATYDGQRAGSIGDVGCFSFSPGKPLCALGNAGIVVTDNETLAARVRTLCTYGFTQGSIDDIERGAIGARFEYEVEGYNARLDEVQAAVLRVKLPCLDAWVERRRAYAGLYREMLSDLEPAHLILPKTLPASEPAPRVFVIRTSRREELLSYLADAGIWCGVPYIPPLHLQSVYAYLGYSRGDFPATERVADELLALPSYPEMTREEVAQVGGVVRRFFRS